MKKILALLLSIFLCFGIVGCSEDKNGRDRSSDTDEADSTVESVEVSENSSDESSETSGDVSENGSDESSEIPDKSEDNKTRPLLYKVTDDEGNVVWLFGSIHVGREDFYPLPDYVLDAFNGSDALAVEADVIAFERDIGAQVKVLKKFIYTDGTKISKHIPKETYNAARQILKENKVYNYSLDYYSPIIWSSVVDNCLYEKIGADAKLGIDRHLMDLADDSDKEILEVESVDFQYNMLNSFSNELQLFLLQSSVYNYNKFEKSKEEIDELLDMWANGDEDEFYEYFENEEDENWDKDLHEEYNNAMIVERNKNMTKYAEQALKSGEEIFICVGAAHVVGEGAMAEQLRDLGYTVEVIR